MLFTMALRNVGRNKRRSVLSGLAIGISAMIIVLAFSFREGLQRDLYRNVTTHITGEVRIQQEGYAENQLLNPLALVIGDEEAVRRILAEEEAVQAYSPRIIFASALYKDGKTYPIAGLGVDITLEASYQDLAGPLGRGRLPKTGEREALIGARLADQMGLALGDKITLITQTRGRGSNAMTFEIVGTLVSSTPSLNSIVMMPLDRVQRLLRMPGMVTEFFIKVGPGHTPDEAARGLQAKAAEAGLRDLDIRSWKEIGTAYNLLSLYEVSYNFIAVFFFALGSTVIFTTTLMVVFERRREIGTLAAMGMERGSLIRLFFLEALIISAVGALAGVIAGIGITLPLSVIGLDFGNAWGDVDLEVSPVLHPILNLKSTAVVFVYAMVVSSLATLIPSRSSTKVKPVEALRTA